MFTTWINKAKDYSISESSIQITADKNTDTFNNPLTGDKCNCAAIYAKEVNGDFTLSCKVTPHFKYTYDAGSIILYINGDNWIKFAYEYTDIGHNAVVSVVTNEFSDDSNGEVVNNQSIWMKMSKKDNVIGLYFSLNSIDWRMVRIFKHNIKEDDIVYVGLCAQSPIGEGCTVDFENIKYTDKSVDDFRKGQ